MKHKVMLSTLVVLLLGLACTSNSTSTDSKPARVSLDATNSQSSASNSTPTARPAGDQIDCAPAQGETVAIATAKLYVEYNATDEDLGVHGAFDDHGWSELCIYDPSGAQVLAAKPQGQLKDLTMASIFFESREPPSSEFSFADLKASFPEGQYEVRGLNFDGTWLTGAATFSHNVPAPPVITFPELAEGEEEAGEAVVSAAGLVVEWQDVTETVDGAPLTITGYEIIITQVEHDDPHGYSQPIFDVHVPADRNSLSVPAEFIELDTVYELEVLALEESGNQTISVGFFKTDDGASSGSANEFAAALPKIEYNALAGDLGFHVELDGDPFKRVSVFGPDGSQIFDVEAQGSVAAQGLTSFAFESAEPPLEELPLDEFLARFPEGDYVFAGETIEGEALKSVAEFTHIIPEPPQIISPVEGETRPLDEVLIAWEPVTSPGDVEIEVYLVQVFPVDPPEGQDPIELDIDLLFEVPAFVTEVRIPPEFLMPDAAYQYEVTAVSADGNQTLTGGTFVTAE